MMIPPKSGFYYLTKMVNYQRFTFSAEVCITEKFLPYYIYENKFVHDFTEIIDFKLMEENAMLIPNPSQPVIDYLQNSSSYDLAQKSGIDIILIDSIRNGSYIPNIELIFKIARVIGIDPNKWANDIVSYLKNQKENNIKNKTKAPIHPGWRIIYFYKNAKFSIKEVCRESKIDHDRLQCFLDQKTSLEGRELFNLSKIVNISFELLMREQCEWEIYELNKPKIPEESGWYLINHMDHNWKIMCYFQLDEDGNHYKCLGGDKEYKDFEKVKSWFGPIDKVMVGDKSEVM